SGRLIYSTFAGGIGEGGESGLTIAVDSTGNAFVSGYTYSPNFPVLNATQRQKSGKEDAFVLKLDPQGVLLYSTFLGGTGEDQGMAITINSSQNAFVAGWTCSTDFPVVHALQSRLAGACDAFQARLSAAGKLLNSTYLGGDDFDSASGIALNAR